MPRPAPSIIDRTKNWIKLLNQRSRSASIRPDEGTGGEFFSDAHDFTISDAQFVNELKINYINNVVSSRQAAFELLEPFTCLGATKDSSARHPPPRCHPETRLKIRERLTRWLLNDYDEWKMLWVRGYAGTGKSAVAQSFGDSCDKKRHGASYFFSRAAGRNKPETVVPTIVYQLATTILEYRSLIGHQLANNPLLLRNSPPVQFRELIVEPFADLQRQRRREPIVIILDGLDECEGEDAQLEILDMITNALRTNPALPLRWLILSRPEAHLKDAFSKYTNCSREELIIDATCRDDVEKYTRDGISLIKDKFSKFTPPDWPPADQLQELIDRVSGLFVYASTCLHFISDRDEANPQSQLNTLLTFMNCSSSVLGSRSPLAALDLLYSQILGDIPPTVFKTTQRILAFMSYQSKLDQDKELSSAQILCNFLRLDQYTFYNASRGLHSVMAIPESEDAGRSQVQFYHASFQDFLLDPKRSGKFAICEKKALVDFLHSLIYWLDVDMKHFYTRDGWNFDYDHKHDSLPGLTWASEENKLSLSQSITSFLGGLLSDSMLDTQWDCVDGGLLSQLSDLDFRFWMASAVHIITLLCGLDPSTSFVRLEPSNQMDHQLFEYFHYVIWKGVARPAKFPLRNDLPEDEWIREYFFIGHGVKSVMVWTTKASGSDTNRVFSVRSDEEPPEAQISQYQDFLQDIDWDEGKAELEMK